MTAIWASTTWMLRRSLVGLGTLLIGIVAFEMIQPVVISSFGDLDRLLPFLEFLPNSLWALMNVTPDFLGVFGLAGYLSLGYNHSIYLIMTLTSVIWFASRAIAGEMERGSLQFVLSRPSSRPMLYGSVVIALLLITTIFAMAGPLGMYAGIYLAQPEGSFDRRYLIVAGAASWLLIWSVAGLTLMGSALSSTMSRSIGIAIGVLVMAYVIDYFAALWSVLVPLTPLSIFSYYEPSKALALGELPVTNILVLGLVGLLGAAGGLAAFVRRDLPV